VAGSPVEEIKARLDVADLVGQTVALKRSGRSFKGLCPFHGEKTPSFYVFPETGTWKCFGCGEGGDLFTFVQKRDNLDFVEALQSLAQRAGVELPERAPRQPEEIARDERRQSLLAQAELYFRAALDGLVGTAARAYLEHRAVNRDSVERFGLGYAPASGLLRHLQTAGYPADEVADVGLAGQRDDGSRYEMFRERLMFPIRDPGGRTISFGGRILGDGQPKYLNGPQTNLFDKGGCLFGLDLARPAIRQSGQAVIVEGYLDVVMAHQHGFQNVVATLGTALTERHLDLLGRRAREILLALDADAAGQAATRRGLDVAQGAAADAVVPVPTPGARGLIAYQAIRQSQIKVLTLPNGLDPDDLIRQDPAQWQRLVSGATAVVDFVLSRLGERHDLSTPSGKREAVHEAMAVIRDLTDPVERAHYLQRLAAVVGLDESNLRQLLNRVRPRTLNRAAEATPSEERAALPEAYLLALYFLAQPDGATLAEDVLSSPEARAISALFGTADPPQRDVAALARLAEQADPLLHAGLAEIAAWLSRVDSLEPRQRTRELEVAQLKLRQQQLRLQHRQVLSLLADSDSEDPAVAEPAPAALLARIAGQLRDIEAGLAGLHGVGSLVWRSRQAAEVLGG
jgi:DNA primase